MHSKLTAYITTGPRPEAAWAKAAGLPHLNFTGAYILLVIIAIIFAGALFGLVKRVFS